MRPAGRVFETPDLYCQGPLFMIQYPDNLISELSTDIEYAPLHLLNTELKMSSDIELYGYRIVRIASSALSLYPEFGFRDPSGF